MSSRKTASVRATAPDLDNATPDEPPRCAVGSPPDFPTNPATGYPDFDAFARVGDAHDEAIVLAGQLHAFQSLCVDGGSVKGDDLFFIFNALGQQCARVAHAIERESANG